MAMHVGHHGNFGYATVTANARRSPDRVAITADGRLQITFAELDRRVNRMAHALLAAGVTPGSRVSSLFADPLHVVDVYLAESKIGASIAALSPYWPLDTLVAMAERSGSTAFVHDAGFTDVVRAVRPRLPGITTWLTVDDPGDDGSRPLGPLVEAAPDDEPPLGAHHDDEWMLLYTGGTTGLPKAVVYSHATGLGASNIWTDVPHDDASVWGTGPIIWGSGFPSVMGVCLAGGLRVALESDFGPAAAIRAIERERVTHMGMLPSFWTEVFRDPANESIDLSSLQVVLLGSEPLPGSLLRRIRDRIPGCALYSFYGCTEGLWTTFGRLDDDDADIRSSGRARSTCAVRVVDQQGRRVLDAPGTICLAGPHVAAGYLDRPDLDVRHWRDGWFVTEDLGVQSPDGSLVVLGRQADAIRIAGEWVLPATIEDAALSLPAVAEAGAVGIPEAAEEQQILLAVTLVHGAVADEASLAAALALRLPPRWLPTTVVIADALPHNEQAAAGTGKLLRPAIRERWGHLVGPVAAPVAR